MNQVNDNEGGTIKDESADRADANEIQNLIAGESLHIEPSDQISGIESSKALDFLEIPRVDLQPIGSTMLEGIQRRILGRDPLIDDTNQTVPTVPTISNDRSTARTARTVSPFVVSSGNSANNLNIV